MSSHTPSLKGFAAAAIAFAVLAFAPGSVWAQRGGGGGGHAGGGGGGHFGGGGGFGGGHYSGGSHPAASHSAPATHSTPVTTSRPAVSTSSSTNESAHAGGATGNAIAHTPSFGPAASGSSGASTAFMLHGHAASPRTTVIGFPPSDSHVSTVDPALRTGNGALSFSGQGREIWQNSPSSGVRSNAVGATPKSESERALFSRSPAPGTRPISPHRIYYHGIGSPFAYYPAFFWGSGFYGCDPFWGFDPAFGCGYGYGGFGVGYGFGGYYGGGFGYDDSFSVGATSGPSDFENDAPADGYGAYSPAPADNSAQPDQSNQTDQQGTVQATDQGQSQDAAPAQPSAAPASPPATMIFFKDGTSTEALSYWLDAGKLHYITNYGGEISVDTSQLDLQRTVDENARTGVNFTLRPAAPKP